MTLPESIWWPLEIYVSEGESTPIEVWIWWHYQFLLIKGIVS